VFDFPTTDQDMKKPPIHEDRRHFLFFINSPQAP
jgi:hypothetical protein